MTDRAIRKLADLKDCRGYQVPALDPVTRDPVAVQIQGVTLTVWRRTSGRGLEARFEQVEL